RGRFRDRIVADENEGSAVGCGPAEIRVAQRIACPVQSRRLAVPDADNAVVFAVRRGGGQLRTLHGIDCQLFVDARPEDDVLLVEEFTLPDELQVVAGEW